MLESHDLFEAATAAMAKAYAPYSKFPVGAAIRTVDGRIFAGCNIEIGVLSGRLVRRNDCARALHHGRRRQITEIAVVAERMPGVTPCGGCRQRLAEFAGTGRKLHLCDDRESSRPYDGRDAALRIPG